MNETDVAKPDNDALAAVVLAAPPAETALPAAVLAPRSDPASIVAPPAMPDLFGKSPVLRSENINLYDALLARIVAAARPRDPFEWMLLKDYADLAWEIFRLRRVKVDCVDSSRRTAVYSVFKRLGLDAVEVWKSHNEPETKALVAQQLAEHGFDEEIIAHEAVVLVSEKLSALDAAIRSIEQRRNAMLRELDHHRAGLGTRLRAGFEVVDAEIEDVPPVAAKAESQPAHIASAQP